MATVRRLPLTSDSTDGYRTRFVLEPMGVGTSELEALTSLFCRIAERHWMLTIPLWNAIADEEKKVKGSHQYPRKRYVLRSANGHGRVTSAVVELLKREAISARQLTLLAWKEVLDPMGHGLLRPTRAWCPLCWQVDLESGNPIYLRLLWTIEAVTICPKHNIELQTACPKCGSAQEVLPRIPRPAVCKSCGADFVQLLDRRRLRASKPDGKSLWNSTAIAALIRCTCAVGVDIASFAFRDVLNALAQQHFDGSMDALSDAVGMSRRMLGQWATGVTNPYLTGLLEFAYRIQVPPDVLLLQGSGLTDPASWLKGDLPIFVKREHKLSKARLDEIHAALRKAIRSKGTIPTSVKKFAQEYGTTYMVIRYNFPFEYKALQAMMQAHRQIKLEQYRVLRIEGAVAAAHDLASKGIYPSDRALKEKARLIPSDLRRKDVRKELRTLRLDFLAGIYRGNRREKHVPVS